MSPVCLPLGDPNGHWNRYCPSWPAAIVFCALFGLTMTLHIGQAWYYKKHFLWVLIMGAAWEFIAATTRVASIQDPTNKNVYETSFVMLVLAPLWINAFDYILLGRMTWYYLPDKALFGIKATRLGVYFVLLDITCFIVQLAGALMTTSQTSTSTLNGLHVYTAGVALQQTVILVFFALSIFFLYRLRKIETTKDKRKGVILVIVLYISLVLISCRIIFRILEFSAGSRTPLNNTIDGNEWFVYVFDIGPMFLALITFHFYHPGKVLVGPDSEFPKKTKKDPSEKQSRWRKPFSRKARI